MLLSSDPGIASTGNTPVFVGKALRRRETTLNASKLSGSSIFHSDADAISGGVVIGRAVEVGIIDWNGKGAFTGSADSNKAGAVTLAANNPLSGAYATPDAFGRVALTDTGGSAGPVLYLIGPNPACGLEDNPDVTILQFEKQTPPAGGFTLPSVIGGYSQGSLCYTFEHQNVFTGEIVSNGDGGLTGTVDTNLAGDVTVKSPEDGKYAGETNGRFLLTFGTATSPIDALYVVSPTQFYLINIDGGVWNPLVRNTHQ